MSTQWLGKTRRRNRYTFWQVYPAFVRVTYVYLRRPHRWATMDYEYARLAWRMLWVGKIDLTLWEMVTVRIIRGDG